MVRLLRKISIKALLQTLYVSVCWLTYICVNVTNSKGIAILLTLFVTIATYFFIDFLFKKIDKCPFQAIIQKDAKSKIRMFIIVAIACFVIMMVWYMAYYPGSFSLDSLSQYGQVMEEEYNDWHPVLHTLVFFALPIRITGEVSAIVLFQMVYFSILLGYLGMIIGEYIGVKQAFISLAYILLNPYTGHIMLYPWKDVGFALAGLLCMCMVFEFYYLNDAWCQKTWKMILWGIVIACSTLFRHNAVLFTGTLLIALFFNLKRKYWLQLTITVLVVLVIVKGPVYYFLEVEQPGSRVAETMGLPLTVIGNVATETPERLDEELNEFVYAMATLDEWKRNYVCGNFNSIKWAGADLSIVEEKGYSGVIQLMFKCFQYSPKASFKALFLLTDTVYGIENGLEGNVGNAITDNDYGIKYAGNETLKKFVDAYSVMIDKSILRYLRTYGVVILAMLLAILGKLNWKSWLSWKKTLLLLPIFIYDFGTMLFLSGPDSRFFFITFLVCPLVVLLALYQREK